MLYRFVCDSCGRSDFLVRSVSERDHVEPCTCGHVLSRTFTPPSVSVIPPYKENFHPAFGKVISSRSGLKEELRKYQDANGSELVEVGNDNRKPRRELDYSFDEKRAAHELEQRWK